MYQPLIFTPSKNQSRNIPQTYQSQTRSDILQGQAQFRGVKQLRRCLVMLNNFEKFSFPSIEKDGQKTDGQKRKKKKKKKKKNQKEKKEKRKKIKEKKIEEKSKKKDKREEGRKKK